MQMLCVIKPSLVGGGGGGGGGGRGGGVGGYGWDNIIQDAIYVEEQRSLFPLYLNE